VLHAIIVIAKSPLPGRVKTRLCPPLSLEQAAVLADAAISDTLHVTGRVSARRHVLALQGPAWTGVPRGWDVVAQVPGDLDQRLVGAFAAAGRGPSLLVGMDTPQLHATQLKRFEPSHFDACIGLADDGGYWAIGFRDPPAHADVIRGVPMSTSSTGAVQLDAMRSRGLRVQLLDQMADFDTYEQATVIAEQYPRTRFAGAFRSVALQRVG
jgi:uncharacterized protein